jgi:hypothetical protein
MNSERPGYRIYRVKSYSNKPWALYLGNRNLGTFHSIESIKEHYPDAEYKTSMSDEPSDPDTQATPQTLTQAIKNGLSLSGVQMDEIQIELVRQHVLDYLAQKFAFATLMNPDEHARVVQTLFEEIKKEIL